MVGSVETKIPPSEKSSKSEFVVNMTDPQTRFKATSCSVVAGVWTMSNGHAKGHPVNPVKYLSMSSYGFWL